MMHGGREGRPSGRFAAASVVQRQGVSAMGLESLEVSLQLPGARPRHVLGYSRRRLLTSWHGVAVRVGYHFLVQGLVPVPNRTCCPLLSCVGAYKARRFALSRRSSGARNEELEAPTIYPLDGVGRLSLAASSAELQ